MKCDLKCVLKKILPPPINVFNREVNGIKAAMLKQTNVLKSAIAVQNEDVKRELANQNKNIGDLLADQKLSVTDSMAGQIEILNKQVCEQNKHFEQLLSDRNREMKESIAEYNEKFKILLYEQRMYYENVLNEQKTMFLKQLEMQNEQLRQEVCKGIEDIKQKTIDGQRFASEAVWAQVFKDTILDSSWLKDKTFSPGRWAAGYPYLYALYRVLNEAKPKRILELGLGQTTRMISQYAAANPDVKHFVVENDSSWIEFFKSGYEKLDNTEIVQLDLEMVQYKNVDGVRTYKGFAERFAGRQFDLICVDAPWAGDMLYYARIDILSIIPTCLDNDFVIIVDDYDRKTEQETVAAIIKCLESNDIDYKRGIYRGKKDTALICAMHKSFLASM